MDLISELQPSFVRGMNSGLQPGLIGSSQAWLIRNCSTRGGRLRTRARWVRRKTLYTGNPQGGMIFSATGEIMLSLGGHILAVDGRSFDLRIFTNESSRNSALNAFAYWCETEGSIILQDGHGYPWVYDGDTARRFTPAAGDSLPIGTVMAYGNGRLTIATGNAKQARIGDIRQQAHQSELMFTETGRLLGGGDLSYPRAIKALGYTSVVDTSSGQGPLIVGLRTRAYTVHTDNPARDTWATTRGFETELFPTHGITGPYALAQVNQDLYFRAVDGLRSIRLTISDLAGPGATPLSREMAYRFDTDTEWMLDGCSIAAFDNRLFCTHSPSMLILDNSRIVHTGVASLNFDLVSSLGQKANPAFDGEWRGVPVVQLIAGEIDEERRLFALCREGDANTLWEFLPERLMRTDVSRGTTVQDNPQGYVETRVHYGPDPRFYRKLMKAVFHFTRVHGYCRFDVSFRAEGASQWTEWDTFKFQADTGTFLDPVEDEVRELATNTAPDTFDEKTQRTVNIARGFQLKLSWCGDLEFTYEVVTDEVGAPQSNQNQTESVELSAVECPDELPAEPTSPLIGPSLTVLQEIYVDPIIVEDEVVFDPVVDGGTSDVTLYLRNDGGTVMTLASVAVSGAQFSITDDPGAVTIEPGESVALGLRGTGYLDDTYEGTLTITTDDPESPREIALSLVSSLTPDEPATPIEPPFDTIGFTPTDIAFDSEGRIYVCGSTNLVRCLATGVVDPDWTAPTITGGTMGRIDIDSSDRVVCMGTFTTINGTARSHLCRMNPDSSLDMAFDPNLDATLAPGFDVVVAANDKIYVMPIQFSPAPSIGGTPFERICRLNADGTHDTGFTFSPTTGYQLWSVVVTDDAVFTFGHHQISDSGGRYYVAKLDLSGDLVTAFNAGSFVVDEDNFGFQGGLEDSNGKIVAWGRVQLVAGTTIGVMRFDPTTGASDMQIVITTAGSVDTVQERADGTLICGGNFATFAGDANQGLAKCSATGVADAAFDKDLNGGNDADCSAINGADQVAIGGPFSTVGGATRTKIAAINPDDSLV